ncbi:MAG: hypothetical protein MUE44_11685 [Oscillatoriaceae cyanobacterium Prado104]|nr:hypothetical protein [Oscillatoriaceae cyanobacterium Prado104]
MQQTSRYQPAKHPDGSPAPYLRCPKQIVRSATFLWQLTASLCSEAISWEIAALATFHESTTAGTLTQPRRKLTVKSAVPA